MESFPWKDDDGKDTSLPIIRWEKTPPPAKADDLVNDPEPTRRTTTGDAIEWLKSFLANGPRESREIIKAAGIAGYAKRTVGRAQERERIPTRTLGKPPRSYWALTAADLDDAALFRHFPHLKKVGETGGDETPTAEKDVSPVSSIFGKDNIYGKDGNVGIYGNGHIESDFANIADVAKFADVGKPGKVSGGEAETISEDVPGASDTREEMI